MRSGKFQCEFMTQGRDETAGDFANEITQVVNNIYKNRQVVGTVIVSPTSDQNGRKEVLLQWHELVSVDDPEMPSIENLKKLDMNIPKLVQVDSTNIDVVGYDEVLMHLFVGFKGKSGEMWMYEDVPSNVYHDFINAPSVGTYYARYIKTNQNYKAQKVWNVQGIWQVLK